MTATSIQLPLPFPPEVIWKPIPGYEELYQVSDTGLVKRMIQMHSFAPGIMKGGKSGSGYSLIRLLRDGNRQTFYIHRLVMLAFVGECPKGQEVNHIDGDKSNNHRANLEYITHRQNINHSTGVLKRHGGVSGATHHRAKLTDEKVREIRRLHEAGFMQIELAAMYGVSQPAIGYVIRGKLWKHVK
jgi:hypothetical protein